MLNKENDSYCSFAPSNKYEEKAVQDILKNKCFFKLLCEEIFLLSANSGFSLDVLRMAELAGTFSIGRVTGFYSHPATELPFLQLAEKLPLSAETKKPFGTLHVMSLAYPIGGHTQVVRRWIESCPDDEPHHLVLTSQRTSDIPPALKEAVSSRGGHVFSLLEIQGQTPDRQPALLRFLGEKCRRIILSTHNNDPLPIIAFGHKDFTRPVFIIDHASHEFWLGRSIADGVITLIPIAETMTKLYRGMPRLFPVPLLMPEAKETLLSKREARDVYKIPPDVPVMLTIGRQSKLAPVGKYDIRRVVRRFLERCPTAFYLLAGVEADEPMWVEEVERAQGRIRLLGMVARTSLPDVLQAADVMVESFPHGGGMATLDGVQHHLPVLSLKLPGFGMLGLFAQDHWISPTEDDLVERMVRLAGDAEKRVSLAEEQHSILTSLNGVAVWEAGVKRCLAYTAQHQTVSRWPVSSRLSEYEILNHQVKNTPANSSFPQKIYPLIRESLSHIADDDLRSRLSRQFDEIDRQEIN